MGRGQMGWALGAALAGLALVGSGGFAAGEGTEYEITDGTYTVTDDNYKSFQKEFSAKKNSACIILVTSQNCQDCKQLDSTWAKVAENFENRTDVPITIASMDESLWPGSTGSTPMASRAATFTKSLKCCAVPSMSRR